MHCSDQPFVRQAQALAKICGYCTQNKLLGATVVPCSFNRVFKYPCFHRFHPHGLYVLLFQDIKERHFWNLRLDRVQVGEGSSVRLGSRIAIHLCEVHNSFLVTMTISLNDSKAFFL